MRAFFVQLAVILALAAPVAAAQPTVAKPTGVVEGVVSTQAGTIPLPGALVSIVDASGREIANQLSSADGSFRIENVAAGIYQVTGIIPGLKPAEMTVSVARGRVSRVLLDLPLVDLTEHVEVVAPKAVSEGGETIAQVAQVTGKEMDQFNPGGSYQAALRLLASVLTLPTGISIRGGRPDQAAVQIGAGTLIDPSTGLAPLKLPADAIDSVQVLANPYAVEFGRFSSGLVVINTRRAGDHWKVRLNDLDPNFRTERYNDWKIIGLQEFAPRLEAGGPLVPQKVFFEQTAQFRYFATDVPSRPEDELKTDRWLSTLSRVDAALSPRQSLVASFGLYGIGSDQATLGTFTPPDATVNLHDHAWHASAIERGVWNDKLLTESTLRVQRDTTEVDPQGGSAMQLQPDVTLGNFFNVQQRTTSSYQWVNTASMTQQGPFGSHYVKVGIDLLHTDYDGWSDSRPVIVERPDGTVTRRLDFTGGRAFQEVPSTDAALFAQDRVQPDQRFYVEFGGRLDRDGVLDRWNITPRAGVALMLDPAGDTVLRGGWGLFYERTPSAVGAFDQTDVYLDTRFDATGTPIATPVPHVIAPDLQTPRSSTWNVTLDQRVNATWSWHVGLLDRTGSHGLIVQPLAAPADPALLLSSTGRSDYRDAEVGVHYKHGTVSDIQATYIRSYSRGDLNSFMSFYGLIPSPIVGANAYAATAADVPNRLVVRGRVSTDRWLFLGLADWHSGFPYSVVNDTLDFVGPRNVLRFPTVVRTELGVERRFNIMKWRPWIGVRANNPFDAFLPTDVQANLASPNFGSFYNSEIRRFRLIIRFER